MIEGTLDIARIESGSRTLDVKPLDFPECLQQIIGMFELQAQQGARFRLPAGRRVAGAGARRRAALPPDSHQRTGQCRQIHGTRYGQSRVEYLRDMACLDIRDTGPGIPAQDMELIFEPFVRGSSAQAVAAAASA